MKNWLKGKADRVVVDGAAPVCHSVTSSVPLGSTLGPVLPSMFMSNLGAGVECTISKFADETKLGCAIGCLKGQDALQRDLGRLGYWAMINGMKFNKSKCWILHLGQSNIRHNYKSGEERLKSSPAGREI